jgi:hypothetical protein
VYLSLRRFLWLGPLTVFLSIAAVLAVRGIAVSLLGPAPSFVPLRVLPPIVDTTALVTWAVIVFAGMVRYVSDPVRKFKTVALIVLLLSFLPDIALAKWRVWGATWTYSFALMMMHVAAWAACVTVLTRLGPVPSIPVTAKARSQRIGPYVFIAVLGGVAILSMGFKDKLALIAVVTICSMYGVLLNRLRKRRIGSAAVGSFYDMLEQDKRKAVEIIVEQKAEEQAPEDAEGAGPDKK